MINEGDIIVGGVPMHVAVNWNSISGFLSATGQDTMSAVVNIGELKPSQLATLVCECVKEGERLQGRESALDAQDIGALMGINAMTEFMQIFSKAMSPDLKKKE